MQLRFLLVLLVVFTGVRLLAQAPNISYAGPQNYTIGTAIKPLVPTNTGGAVPATVYGQVTTYTGVTSPGTTNGTLSSATFYGPRCTATDAAGNMYVTDANNNLIRKITPVGVVSTLAGNGLMGFADGAAASASFFTPCGIAIDASGNIFVADFYNNRIREITTAGVVVTFAGNGNGNGQLVDGVGAAASFYHPYGLAFDASGNLFVIDTGNDAVRKITPAGVVSTVAGNGVAGSVNGTGSNARFNDPAGIAIDAAGNLFVSDRGNNLVRKITQAGVVSTFAGNGNASSTDGMGTLASFNTPFGLAFDGLGNLYVIDYSSNTIRVVTSSGIVTTLAGNGTSGSNNGTGTSVTFYQPVGVQNDGKGNLFICDYGNNEIRKVSITGYTITPLLPSGLLFDNKTGIISGTPNTTSTTTNYTITATNATGTNSTTLNLATTIPPVAPSITSFTPATGIAGTFITITGTNLLGATGVSISGMPVPSYNVLSSTSITTIIPQGAASGSVAVSNQYGTGTLSGLTVITAPNISYTTPQNFTKAVTITPLSPVNTGGAVPATVYGQITTYAGNGIKGSTNGAATSATFASPRSIAFDASGNMYVTDGSFDNQIRKITPAGVVSTLAGTNGGGYTDGTGTSATFNAPNGIAVDVAGNVYVADYNNNRIRKITPAGVVTTFAGTGNAILADGTGTSASFYNPFGLTIDVAGNLYVGDSGNNAIRKITPAGVVTTIAGTAAPGFVNGTGTAAQFNGPSGMAVDAAGNIFVSDRFNNSIRKITPAGVVTTFAGTGSSGSANGTGTSASFYSPIGLTFDGAGNLYEADYSNNEIRMITPAGVVSTFAGKTTAGLTNGTLATSAFNGPVGVTNDGIGNLYVTDLNNYVIRKIVIAGYSISPTLPAGLSFDASTGIISGKPTVLSPATNYTITAYNVAGSSITIVTIGVVPPYLDKTGVSQSASSAYSLRQLKTIYTHSVITPPTTITGFTNSLTPVVRIRRSSDDKQLDIGYTAAGDLDTVTLKSFVGNANGYVATWYDQSSNSYDVTQPNASLQPVLVTNGVVERSGVMPAVRFITQAQTVLQATVPAASMFGSGYIGSVFPVLEASGASVTSSAFGYGSGNDRWQVHAIQGMNFDVGNPFNRIYVTDNSYTGVIRNYSLIADVNLQQIYVNGVIQASSTAAMTPCTQSQFNIGGVPNLFCYHNNHESELIIYNTQLSTADRQTMETNQVTYYAVYTAPTVTAFSPASGSSGTSVTITGTNFSNVTGVTVGGTAASSFTVNSPTSITAIVGAGASGSVTVTTTKGSAGLAGFQYGSGLEKTGITRPASSAYSLRQLKTNYTHSGITAPTIVAGFTNSATPVIRVRRSSDNAQLDIGYTATGDLDTTTLKSFVGINNGYVTTWYDQSSNSYDVTQSSIYQQPFMVTNGVVERSGAMPAIRFNNAAQTVLQNNISASAMFGSGYIASVFPVMEASGATVKSSAFGYGSGSDRWQVHAIQGANFDVGNPFNRIYVTNDAYTNVLKNYSLIADANLQQIYVNGAIQASSTTAMTPCTQTQFNIGGIPNFFCYHDNHESELIIYNIQLSTADRQTMEGNQYAYYNPQSQSNNSASAFTVNMTQPNMAASASEVKLNFNAIGGEGNSNYQVQKLGTSGFSSIANLTGTGTGDFTTADTEPLNGNNYYRVAATDSKGKLVYSSTVNLNVLSGGKGISVYPNPVSNSNMILNFNRMNKGTYNLTLIDAIGNVVLKKAVSYDGYSSSVAVPVPNTKIGVYILNIASDAYQRTLRLIFE